MIRELFYNYSVRIFIKEIKVGIKLAKTSGSIDDFLVNGLKTKES